MYEDKRPEAAALYINQGKSIQSIADEMRIGRSTIARWAKEENWKAKRQKMHDRAVKRATTAQVRKEAKKLQTLNKAANKAENALMMAAGLVESALLAIETMPKDEKSKKESDILNGYALKNLQSLAEAISSQTKTAFLLRGMLTEAEKKRLELDRRKVALEEKRLAMDAEESKEEPAGFVVEFPAVIEDILEGKRRHDGSSGEENVD